MQLTVKFFGPLREEAGAKELGLELPAGSRVADLRELLAGRSPLLAKLGGTLAEGVPWEGRASAEEARAAIGIPRAPPGATGALHRAKAQQRRAADVRVRGDTAADLAKWLEPDPLVFPRLTDLHPGDWLAGREPLEEPERGL